MYVDDIHAIRHSHLPHAFPAIGIATKTAHLFLLYSFSTYVHSNTASLALLSVNQWWRCAAKCQVFLRGLCNV